MKLIMSIIPVIIQISNLIQLKKINKNNLIENLKNKNLIENVNKLASNNNVIINEYNLNKINKIVNLNNYNYKIEIKINQIKIPKEKNIISCKWVFSCKQNDKDKITKYKARLSNERFFSGI